MGEQEKYQFGFTSVRMIRDDLLGKGAYGAVYKARCDRLVCAAKELHQVFFKIPDPGEEDLVCRFQNECSLLSQLKHPNVVQYLGTYREAGSRTVVLLMELLDSNLHSYIERHKHSSIPFYLEVNFSHDVALALDFLHTNGIQHRDLSCKNILLLGEVRAKVSDFGVSKLSDPAAGYSVQSMCPGAVVYMPPEAILPMPKYSQTFDEFSLGVCMIQMLGRKFPNPTDPYIQHDTDNGMDSIQLSIVPELQRRRSDIDACDQSNPVLPIALSCISNNEKDRPCAAKISELLSIIRNSAAYRESGRMTSSNGSVSDPECGDFVFIELEENIEQQFQVKIKCLQHQIDEKERLVADAQQIVSIREHQLKMNARLLEEMEVKFAERGQQLADARCQITELQREVDRQQIQLNQARAQRKLLSQKTKSLQSMEDRLLGTMEANIHKKQTHGNLTTKLVTSPARSRLASAPNIPHSEVEASPSSPLHQKKSKTQPISSVSTVSSTTPPPSSPRSFSSSLTSSLTHRKISLAWSCRKESPVAFQPQSSTAVGLGKCLYISHCNYSRTEGIVYEYDVCADLWLALPVINKSEFTVTAVGDMLVAVGGTITLRRCASLLGLKQKSSAVEWKKVLPDMPTARAFPSCCVSMSNLLVVSGGEVSGESSLRVEVMDLQKKRWEIVRSLPFDLGSCTRMFACAATNSDDIFYLGGFDEGSLTSAVFKTNAKALLNTSQVRATSAPLWQTVQELPVAGSSCVTANGQLLSIGGFNKKSRSYSKVVHTYDFASGSWKEHSSMPREFSRGMAGMVVGVDGKEKLVVVGGSTSGGVSCTVSVASLDPRP